MLAWVIDHTCFKAGLYMHTHWNTQKHASIYLSDFLWCVSRLLFMYIIVVMLWATSYVLYILYFCCGLFNSTLRCTLRLSFGWDYMRGRIVSQSAFRNGV